MSIPPSWSRTRSGDGSDRASSRPFTSCSPSSLGCPAGRCSASHVASLSDVWPSAGELLQALAQVHGVADDRVLERAPRSRAARRPRRPSTGRCRAGTARSPSVAHSRVHRGLGSVHRHAPRRAPGRRGRAHGSGAPNTAITASPTYCITVPPSAEDGPVHLGAVRVELRGELRRVGVLGDGRVAADVAHQHRDLELLGLADAPARAASSCSATPAGSRRDSVSPCSSRSTIACVQPPQPLERACRAGGHALGQARRTAARRGRRRPPVSSAAPTAIALIGLPSATISSSASSSASRPPVRRTGLTSALDDRRGRASSRRSPPRGWRGPAGRPRRCDPSAGRRSRPRLRRAATIA